MKKTGLLQNASTREPNSKIMASSETARTVRTKNSRDMILSNKFHRKPQSNCWEEATRLGDCKVLVDLVNRHHNQKRADQK